MNNSKSDPLSKVLLCLAVSVVGVIAIPSSWIQHSDSVAKQAAIHARGEDRLASARKEGAIFKSQETVQGSAAVLKVLVDAIDLEKAMFGWEEVNHAEAGSKVSYAEVAPYLPGNSQIRAMGGKDSEGGTWGPFTVGLKVLPCEATQAKFSKEVQPSYWLSR